jgi:hypothetical protein
MKTVWKFPINNIADYVTLDMPIGAKVLTVQIQQGIPCIWALVDTNTKTEHRRFRIAGTNHDLTDAIDRLKYVGSFQLA